MGASAAFYHRGRFRGYTHGSTDPGSHGSPDEGADQFCDRPQDADMILYMQEGDIKEVGTHGDLIARDGLYAKLYNSQFANENG